MAEKVILKIRTSDLAEYTGQAKTTILRHVSEGRLDDLESVLEYLWAPRRKEFLEDLRRILP